MTQPDEARAREIAEKLSPTQVEILRGTRKMTMATTQRRFEALGLLMTERGIVYLSPLGRLVAAEIARMEARET